VDPRAHPDVMEKRKFLECYSLVRYDALLTVNLVPTFGRSLLLHLQDYPRPLL
jgi:hypothetical protein